MLSLCVAFMAVSSSLELTEHKYTKFNCNEPPAKQALSTSQVDIHWFQAKVNIEKLGLFIF